VKSKVKRISLFLIIISLASIMFFSSQAQAVPGYNDVTFKTSTGGSISWTDETAPYHDGSISTGNFTMSFAEGDYLRVAALPNAGYYFWGYNISATNGTFLATSVMNPYLTYVTSDFVIEAFFFPRAITYKVTVTTTSQGGISWTDETAPYHDGQISTGSTIVTFPVDDIVSFLAVPNTGYDFTYFDIIDSDTQITLLNPTDNPYVLTMDRNYTVTPHFEATISPIPSSPSSFLDWFTLDWISLRLTFTNILMLIIGAIITIIGIVILMRASGAWIPGLIFLVVGFFIQEIAQPNLSGILAFALEAIFATMFLYNSSGSRKK
jgi:hypothetical protein